RPRQAPAHGARGGDGERPGGDHVGQPAHRGSAADPRRRRARCAVGRHDVAGARDRRGARLRRRARSSGRDRARGRAGARRRPGGRRRQGARGLPDHRYREAAPGRPRRGAAGTAAAPTAGAAKVSQAGERLGAETSFGLDEVLAATGGELARLGDRVRFTGVTTDTRTLQPGELFVALRGATWDGHQYLAEAARRGAGAVLGEQEATDQPLGCGVVVVRESLAALGDLAAFHRRRRQARVLAVAGSNGKTTTKEMAAAILREAFGAGAVLQTRGTQNNLVGLPLTLLRLGESQRVAVVELGMNGPGEVWAAAA